MSVYITNYKHTKNWKDNQILKQELIEHSLESSSPIKVTIRRKSVDKSKPTENLKSKYSLVNFTAGLDSQEKSRTRIRRPHSNSRNLMQSTERPRTIHLRQRTSDQLKLAELCWSSFSQETRRKRPLDYIGKMFIQTFRRSSRNN